MGALGPAALVALAAFAGTWAALLGLARRRLRVLAALAAVAASEAPEPEPTPPRPRWSWRPRWPRGARGPAAALLRLGAQALHGTGLPLRPEEFLLLTLGAGLAGGGLGHLLRLGALGQALCAVAGLGAPGLAARRARSRRQAALSAELADALLALAGMLRAGQGLLEAVEALAEDTPPPLGEELRRLRRETVGGIPVEEALWRLVDRTGNRDIELWVTAVLVQRQVGGSLAEVLEQIADTIRARVALRERLRVVTAQSRLTAWVLSVLPVAVFLLLAALDPGLERPLWATPLGRLLASLAAALELLGIVAVRRVADVRY